LLEPINKCAKDDIGKTYWTYPIEESMNFYKQKNILGRKLSVSLAKNIKRKDPVFALYNREVLRT
jgi:hypothetical protein